MVAGGAGAVQAFDFDTWPDLPTFLETEGRDILAEPTLLFSDAVRSEDVASSPGGR